MQRGPKSPPSPGRGHGVGKAAGTGPGELRTGGPWAQRDEGRNREGAVRMVRRSQLPTFIGLCGWEEGIRVRGWPGQGRAARGGMKSHVHLWRAGNR